MDKENVDTHSVKKKRNPTVCNNLDEQGETLHDSHLFPK
jgi:hypothetical protein